MSGSTGRALYIDRYLSEMAIGYMPQGIIAPSLAPIVDVQKQSGLYRVFSRADKLRVEDTARSPGTRANQVRQSVGSGTYYCPNYALSHPVVMEDLENADPDILASDLLDGSQYILDKLLLDWEVRVANQVTSGSNVGSFSAVGSAWNDYTNSDPKGDIETMIDNVRNATGMQPNKITFGRNAWDSFRRNDTVRNLIFGTNNGGGYPSRQAVADLLEVDEILVGEAFQNTAAEDLAENLQQVWDDNVLVSYTAQRPSRNVPSFMYSFRWKPSRMPSMAVERHPWDSRTKSEDIEAGYYQDEKITGAEYGHLLVGVNSSQ